MLANAEEGFPYLQLRFLEIPEREIWRTALWTEESDHQTGLLMGCDEINTKLCKICRADYVIGKANYSIIIYIMWFFFPEQFQACFIRFQDKKNALLLSLDIVNNNYWYSCMLQLAPYYSLFLLSNRQLERKRTIKAPKINQLFPHFNLKWLI